jgi:hypothetical protein
MVPLQSTVGFELKKGGYGFGDDRSGDCIILTSDDFWVDRTEIGRLIGMQGGHCLSIGPMKLMFVIPDSVDADSFIKALKPKIADIGGKIRADWSTSKIEPYMNKKYGKEERVHLYTIEDWCRTEYGDYLISEYLEANDRDTIILIRAIFQDYLYSPGQESEPPKFELNKYIDSLYPTWRILRVELIRNPNCTIW